MNLDSDDKNMLSYTDYTFVLGSEVYFLSHIAEVTGYTVKKRTHTRYSVNLSQKISIHIQYFGSY